MKFTHFSNPFHPGVILWEEFLQPMKLSQLSFAKKLKWSARKLNEIINEKRGVTAESAIDLSRALGTTPEFWLNMQMSHDLAEAYKAKKSA